MKTSSTFGRTETTRRAFVRDGALFLVAGGTALSRRYGWAASPENKPLTLGLVTDLHYADKPTAGSRHYRETLRKFEEAAKHFATVSPRHIVELGDFVDAADSAKTEIGYLRRINREFAALPGKKHYVLGNHCVHTLTKQEFLGTVERKRSYYSFDDGGFHFLVLDACFRSDGKPYGRKNFRWTDPNISAEQVEWLSADMKANKLPTIVFVHQRLDVKGSYGIKNAAAIRRILESSGKVLAVFQGHSHKNEHRVINGIHYCVLSAMIEGSGEKNNGYSTLEIASSGDLKLTGFRKQSSYEWKPTLNQPNN